MFSGSGVSTFLKVLVLKFNVVDVILAIFCVSSFDFHCELSELSFATG